MFAFHLPEVFIGLIFDLLMGDPQVMCHPVNLMGLAIETTKKALKALSKGRPVLDLIAGAITLVLLTGGTYLLVYLFCGVVERTSGTGAVYYLIVGFLSSFSFAVKELFRATHEVIRALPDLDKAREKLSMIVGRDTEGLHRTDIIRATTESLSENLCDSVVAPLFYLFLGGPP